jgi:hypothetical protein
MTHTLQEAAALHRALPPGGWLALREAGLSDGVIHARLIGWDGEHITIPVFGKGREVVWIERAAFDDHGLLAPLAEDGAPALLYNEAVLEAMPPYVVITEGVAECLVLLSQRFDAISGTGGGRTIPKDALEAIRDAREVFVCFKNGPMSRDAACRLAADIPDAQLAQLPDTFGVGEGIGTFFAKRHRNPRDFRRLLAEATTLDASW